MRIIPAILVVNWSMDERNTLIRVVMAVLLMASLQASPVQVGVSEDRWAIKGVQTSYPIGAGMMNFIVGFESRAFFKDNDTPRVEVSPRFAICERHGYVAFSYGDITSDPRYAVFSDMGFDLTPPGKRYVGSVENSQMVLLGPHTESWEVCLSPSDDLNFHLFGVMPSRPEVGFALGSMLEYSRPTGLMRLALMQVDDRIEDGGAWMVGHYTQPIGRGFTGYGSWNGETSMIGNLIDIDVDMIARYSWDVLIGDAFTSAYLIDFSAGPFVISYGLKSVPLWMGSFGRRGHTTRDTPLRRESVSVVFRRGFWSVSASYLDSWWRRSAFAGESQRRILTGRVEILRDSDGDAFGLKGRFQHRYNRSGTESTSLSIDLPLAAHMFGCDVSVSPSVQWNGRFSFALDVDLVYQVEAIGAVDVMMRISRKEVMMRIGFSKKFDQGRLTYSLDNDGDYMVNGSIDPGA